MKKFILLLVLVMTVVLTVTICTCENKTDEIMDYVITNKCSHNGCYCCNAKLVVDCVVDYAYAKALVDSKALEYGATRVEDLEVRYTKYNTSIITWYMVHDGE